jgi:L-ascorbate metabolism protein UlaG (beta-lactamase superfamily)
MKRLIKVLKVLGIIIILTAIGGYVFMKQPQFGENPEGERLQRIKNSPNYIDGKFQNQVEGVSDLDKDSKFNLYGVLKEFFIDRNNRREPPSAIPTEKTDLKNIKPEENIIVWLGHSSFFLQLDGKKFLIDPVLGGYASPLKLYNKSYKGSDVYRAEDIPDIDYLLISHDHYDHLDYDTVTTLRDKVKKVITGLGTGAHFEDWGYRSEVLIEKDWNETETIAEGFEIIVTPARHRSGRGLKSNQSLWVSFVIKAPSMRIYYSGDSGYAGHFKAIGKAQGPFDLAIMEGGQYSKYWRSSHMMPEEVVKASQELKAKKLITGHWAKFTLSLHDWDEPIRRVLEESEKQNMTLLYPKIGEKLDIKEGRTTEKWWERIEK